MQVNSSAIESIDYDPKEQVLLVVYRGGGNNQYKYLGVPSNIWDTLLKAIEMELSVGKFINKYVKNNYSYMHVEK